MGIGKRSSRPGRLFAALALPAALGLGSRDAHATWHATIVDGHNSINSGHTSYDVYGATSAILAFNASFPVYTRMDSAGFYNIYSAYNPNFLSTCSETYSIYSVAYDSLYGVALQDGINTWTAYVGSVAWPSSDDLYVGVSTAGPADGSIAHVNYQQQAQEQPSLAMWNGKPWVVYSLYSAGYGTTSVFYQSYDGSAWSMAQALPGQSGQTNRSMPTSAVFDGKLWVFYWDRVFGGLIGQYTTDGTSWTVSDSGNGGGYIDGDSGLHGQNLDYTGRYPSAFVDTVANRLYVYYYDYSTSGSTPRSLRVSYRDAGTSTWTAGTVEAVTIDYPPAPVRHNGPQVYYVDSTHHTLRFASGSGTSWSTSVVDGGSTATCAGCTTRTTLTGPVAAVEVPACTLNGVLQQPGPHVFYGDSNNGGYKELREVLWY